jgi:hypothetical protein
VFASSSVGVNTFPAPSVAALMDCVSARHQAKIGFPFVKMEILKTNINNLFLLFFFAYATAVVEEEEEGPETMVHAVPPAFCAIAIKIPPASDEYLQNKRSKNHSFISYSLIFLHNVGNSSTIQHHFSVSIVCVNQEKNQKKKHHHLVSTFHDRLQDRRE